MQALLDYVAKLIMAPFLKLIKGIEKPGSIGKILGKYTKSITSYIGQALTLKPSSLKEYVSVGSWLVAKKVFFIGALVACAIPATYFMHDLKALPDIEVFKEDNQPVKNFVYDDIALKGYTGKATIKSHNKEVIYEGDIVDGFCTGKGKLYDAKKELVYEGDFENNHYKGQGKFYTTVGDEKYMYEGTFDNDLYEGEGVLHNATRDTIYKGTFKKGLKEGKGKLYKHDNRLVYDGDFKEGLFEGSGVYKHLNFIYEGNFKKNLFEGEGKIYTPTNRLMYEGFFEKGKKTKSGKVYDVPTGRVIYDGAFFEDKKQGIGTLFDTTGRELFNGKFFQDNIDYSAYVGSTLQEVGTAFKENPILFAKDNRVYYKYPKLQVTLKTSIDKTLEEEKLKQKTPQTQAPQGGAQSKGQEVGQKQDVKKEAPVQKSAQSKDEEETVKGDPKIDTKESEALKALVCQLDQSKIIIEEIIVHKDGVEQVFK